MNPLRTFCLVACLLGAVCATPNQNRAARSLKPSNWLSASQLEALPSLEEVTFQSLERMSLEEGAKLVDQLAHLTQMNHDLRPTFVPSPTNIPTYIVKPNGQKVSGNLNTLVANAKQQQNFADDKVTILITGLPQDSETVAKATRKFVQSYMQYNNVQQRKQQQQQYSKDYDSDNTAATSSEESSEAWKSENPIRGDLVIIDLGATITNFKRFAMCDIEKIGNMMTKVILELDVPEDIIHLVGQGVGAHVAGAAGRQYIRLTGRQLRRITALDPSKKFVRTPKALTGLARGDAEFVDAIHTSVYGLGTPERVGDVDFYPNGPAAGVPGADNVVEASMRATRYYAESVRPGNERNFPAVAANSLQQYKNKNGYGPRAYMGIGTEFDVRGDYFMQVNAKSPFGRSAPAEKQITYHGSHQSWTNKNSQDYE